MRIRCGWEIHASYRMEIGLCSLCAAVRRFAVVASLASQPECQSVPYEISYFSHGPAPRSPLHRLAVRFDAVVDRVAGARTPGHAKFDCLSSAARCGGRT